MDAKRSKKKICTRIETPSPMQPCSITMSSIAAAEEAQRILKLAANQVKERTVIPDIARRNLTVWRSNDEAPLHVGH
jgi:hypothetical protein